MPSIQQMLSDDRIGAETITLELSPDTPTPIAGLPVVVLCDYSGVGVQGLVLPVFITVMRPTGQALLRREFTRMLPASFDFTPIDPGPHMVKLSELHHNRCFGTLEVSVSGDDKETE